MFGLKSSLCRVSIYISWLTVVEGDPKAPFSKATTSRGRRERYSFSWIIPLTLDLYLIIPSVKQGGIKCHFLSLWYDSTRDRTKVARAIGKHSNHYTNGLVLFTNPSARAGYDTRSIFKRSLTGLNSEFSFS